MIFPYGTDARVRYWPYTTVTLIAICSLVFLAELISPKVGLGCRSILATASVRTSGSRPIWCMWNLGISSGTCWRCGFSALWSKESWDGRGVSRCIWRSA